MTATETEAHAAASEQGLWAKLTRRRTRAEYWIGAIVAFAGWVLLQSMDSAAKWFIPVAIFVSCDVAWRLIRPMPTDAESRGGRSDGGPPDVDD
ncbi:hypothetical protein [Candidatus Poriferisodalis sp.]|uniref:hypothetical protein n=1 Tax=Candidatus Poriferisodalis sp. TaxID=3101277 RepID=UPI003C700450